MVLLALVLAASPIPNDSRQLGLSVAVGWDARAAQVRLLEREDAGRPWRAVGESVPAALGRAGLAWGRGLHPAGLSGRFYNRLVDEAGVARDWSSAEDMRREDDLYRLVVLVGHNDAPRAAGGGSCIFLHLRDRKHATTAGCTAFDTDPMERLLRWLDPARRPLLVQLPASALRSVAADRGLPGSWP